MRMAAVVHGASSCAPEAPTRRLNARIYPHGVYAVEIPI
ncbi:hypothetical protein Lokhon_03089 [Limimaricola hongkongensis DSM 17492]|uniref:Uncharacterized protein n=1 Tax=Limimaricola hongkongensis DSM 17492 TaxID=1122180 RepID=A0A017HAV1_9RHOB|nr:hypothetical protein Lokhon_03089 [Limimaricola hongkongensis DSM 17492]